MPVCECEHVAHFRHSTGTPHGAPGHPYDQEFPAGEIVELRTVYGPFKVCVECAIDCHGAQLVNLLDGASIETFLAKANRREVIR